MLRYTSLGWFPVVIKSHKTQGKAVPLRPIFSPRRSLTSNIQKTQGTPRGTLRYAGNRISVCYTLPFLRLKIHVERRECERLIT